MEPNQAIKERREELGLSQTAVSRAAGVSWNEYFDLELHASEAINVMKLGALKAICRVLDLDLLNLVGEMCVDTDIRWSGVPRHELITRRLKEQRISLVELAHRLGFYEDALTELEQREDFLDRWSIEIIRRLAAELELPVHLLLACKCPERGP